MRSRLGSPRSDRSVGRDRWLVYASGRWSLRLRLRPASGAQIVRSWTLEIEDGGVDLPTLLDRLGVRPLGPVEDAPGADGRLLRCEVASADGSASLTARVSGGQITSITAFDEAPDWSRPASP